MAGDARLPFKHVAAVSLGNALAFYDFLAYLAFAVQIGHSFFPDPRTSLLMTYATTFAGFVARPAGAYVMGRVADKSDVVHPFPRRRTIAFRSCTTNLRQLRQCAIAGA